MVVTLTGTMASLLMGGADIGVEKLDAKMGWTKPFKRSKDYVRIAGVGGGIVMDLFTKEGSMFQKIGEALFYSSLPMIERSVMDVAMPSARVTGGGAIKLEGVRLETSGVAAAGNAGTVVVKEVGRGTRY